MGKKGAGPTEVALTLDEPVREYPYSPPDILLRICNNVCCRSLFMLVNTWCAYILHLARLLMFVSYSRNGFCLEGERGAEGRV